VLRRHPSSRPATPRSARPPCRAGHRAHPLRQAGGRSASMGHQPELHRARRAMRGLLGPHDMTMPRHLGRAPGRPAKALPLPRVASRAAPSSPSVRPAVGGEAESTGRSTGGRRMGGTAIVSVPVRTGVPKARRCRALREAPRRYTGDACDGAPDARGGTAAPRDSKATAQSAARQKPHSGDASRPLADLEGSKPPRRAGATVV
jgi:hypothetical protein